MAEVEETVKWVGIHLTKEEDRYDVVAEYTQETSSIIKAVAWAPDSAYPLLIEFHKSPTVWYRYKVQDLPHPKPAEPGDKIGDDKTLQKEFLWAFMSSESVGAFFWSMIRGQCQFIKTMGGVKRYE